MNSVKAALYRLRWVGVIFAAAAIYIGLSGSELLKSQAGVLSWKIVLVTIAVGLADMVRRHLFSYVDLSAHLEEKTVAGAIVFLAAILLYSAIIFSVTAGL